MKTNKKSLSIVLFALIAVIVLGVGYATITAINLTINGTATASPDETNFKVAFMTDGEDTNINYKEVLKQFNAETGQYVDTEINYTDKATKPAVVDTDLTAHFNTQQLSSQGEKAIATYRVKNNSPALKASLSISCSSTNSEYFSTTCKIGTGNSTALLEAGAVATVTVEVNVLKTPVTNNQSSTISSIITAIPENN